MDQHFPHQHDALVQQHDVGGRPVFGLPPGAWQDGETLATSRDVELPYRCVICNAPSHTRLRQRLSWHKPGWYALIPVGLLVYWIAARAASKDAFVAYSLCDTHAHQRKRRMSISGIVAGAGALGWLAGFGGPLGMAGFAVLVAGLIATGHAASVLRPRVIKPLAAFLDGAGSAFLASLPPFRG